MPLPSLPPDVWQRISTLLDPPELSSMSQVNQAFHKIATAETHFRRHLAVPQPLSTIPSIAYRRLCAFSYPPRSTTLPFSTNVDILCIVEDTLILFDKNAGRLISFPNAQTADIDDLIGNQICLQDGFFDRKLVRRHLAILPGGRIAFLKGSNPTLLTVLDVRTWDMTKHVIAGRRRLRKPVLRGSAVFVAGNHGEWIMYHLDNETVALVDWQRGTVIRSVKNIPRVITWKWLMGTCVTTNDRSIVGVVRQENDGSEYRIHAEGFDGIVRTFHSAEEKRVYSVLRSADTKTHVLITRGRENSFGQLAFHAHRGLSDSKQTWNGDLVPLIYTKLLIDGNVIEARPQGHLGGSEYGASDFSQQFTVLQDDGVLERIWSPRLERGSKMVWCKHTSESGLVVIGGKLTNCVEVQKLQKGCRTQPFRWITRGFHSKEDSLHSFSVKGLTDLCVLADHVIVAIRENGNLKSFHFDRFCPSNGAYACPWLQALQSFRFPEVSGLTEPDSPPSKKRRIAVSSGQDSATRGNYL